MSFMFNRYPPPSRRVIFFAREAALHAGSEAIDSSHLLTDLLAEQSTAEGALFHLCDLLPKDAAKAKALTKFPHPRDIPLAAESKNILRYAAEEANDLDDYWIDTDHLVLGMLRQRECLVATKLNGVGLQLEAARKTCAAHQESRDGYGPVPALWSLSRPITRFGRFAGMVYLIAIVVLIRVLSEGSCVSSPIPRK
jgi:ATP-dependent Clp protease ATP-binding subunit ClpA